MATTEELKKQSREIRKLVEAGKTIEEIAVACSLTKSQVKYRVRTKYGSKIAEKILIQLQENEENNAIQDTQEISTQEMAIVVDTCSLKHENSLEVIQRYNKVILTTDVIRELDNLKETEDITLRVNARKLLKQCVEDPKGERFVVEVSEKVSRYTDENLLQYCKGKNVVLYTSDYVLASLAKGYGISYLLGDEEEKRSKEEKKIVQHIPITDTRQLTEMIRRNTINMPQDRMNSIDNVELLDGELVLTIPDTCRINYIVLEKNKIKIPNANHQISLNIESIVFVLTYKAIHRGLCVSAYQIYDIKQAGYATFMGAYKPNCVEEIQALKLPTSVIKKIIDYYYLVRETMNK